MTVVMYHPSFAVREFLHSPHSETPIDTDVVASVISPSQVLNILLSFPRVASRDNEFGQTLEELPVARGLQFLLTNTCAPKWYSPSYQP